MSPGAEPSELPRWIAVRQARGQAVEIAATPVECAALARRFALVAVERLEAKLALSRDGHKVEATGRLVADIVQPCAISGDSLAVKLDEPLHFLFVPARSEAAEEIEVEADEIDEIGYEGDRFDLGEAVAQSLGLAIDPFLAGPDADRVRREVGLEEPARQNAFAALKGLKPPG